MKSDLPYSNMHVAPVHLRFVAAWQSSADVYVQGPGSHLLSRNLSVAQLQDNGIASGSLYAVLHMCSHGILFPRTVYATSVQYYLDDPSRTGKPVGEALSPDPK